MKNLLLFSAMALLSFVSCKKDSKEETVNVVGDWEGYYTGDADEGLLYVNIDANGKLTGTAQSVTYSQSDVVSGTVSSTGNFEGTTKLGATFKGKFSTSAASGMWSNTISGTKISGTWEGRRKK